MQLTTTWTDLGATAGAVMQKHGQVDVLVAYKATTPTNSEDRFVLKHTEPATFPNAGGLKLWARAKSGTAEATVTILV